MHHHFGHTTDPLGTILPQRPIQRVKDGGETVHFITAVLSYGLLVDRVGWWVCVSGWFVETYTIAVTKHTSLFLERCGVMLVGGGVSREIVERDTCSSVKPTVPSSKGVNTVVGT